MRHHFYFRSTQEFITKKPYEIVEVKGVNKTFYTNQSDLIKYHNYAKTNGGNTGLKWR